LFDAPQREFTATSSSALFARFPLDFCDVAILKRENPELSHLIEKLEEKEVAPKYSLKEFYIVDLAVF
jgi:hypothetical protein